MIGRILQQVYFGRYLGKTLKLGKFKLYYNNVPKSIAVEYASYQAGIHNKKDAPRFMEVAHVLNFDGRVYTIRERFQKGVELDEVFINEAVKPAILFYSKRFFNGAEVEIVMTDADFNDLRHISHESFYK